MRSNVNVWNGFHLKRPPLRIFYVSTALSVTTLGDSLLYAILPSCYPHLGLTPFHVGVLLSVKRWIRLGTDGIGSPIFGAIADRIGKEQSILFLFFIGTIAMITAGIYLDPIVLFVIMPVILICNTPLSTLLSSQAGLLGFRSVASFATALDLGMSFGPLLGWNIAQLGFPTNYVFILGGTFYITSAMISFRKFRNLKIN